MFTECKSYLVEHLKAAGIKSNPFTSMAALSKSMESHIGAVLFEKETLLRNGSKTQFIEDGARKKRRKVFDRKLSFTVIIGEYTDEAVEAIYEKFIASLEAGLYVDGNYIAIEAEEAEWIEKDDSILKSKLAVQVMITFDGGIYRDTDFKKLTGLEVVSVEKGKEPSQDGN